MGIDYYYENKTSHNWPEKTNVDTMTLLSTQEWKNIVSKAGFKNSKKPPLNELHLFSD